MVYFLFFFFSSRRRHTRLQGDWSSDVCSSDLGGQMLIVMRHGATEAEIQKVVAVIKEMGYQARPMPGAQRTAVGLVGNDGRVDASRLEGLAGVQEVIHVSKPYKQVSREWKAEPTVIRLAGGGAGGGGDPVAGRVA